MNIDQKNSARSFALLLALTLLVSPGAKSQAVNTAKENLLPEKSRVVLFQTKSLEGSEKKVSPVIKFVVTDSWAEPYAFYDEEKDLIDGVMKDFFDALSRKMGMPYEHVHLARKRIDDAAEKGLFNLRCYANEDWVAKPELYSWTQPLFHIVNSIVWKKGHSAVAKIDDLQQKTLGTVLGYSYRKLDQLFSANKIVRKDMTNEPANIQALQKDRLEYIVAELGSFEWYLKTEDVESLRNTGRLQFDKIPIKCGILKSGEIKLKEVEAAIEKLKQEGFFRRLVVKYGLR